MTKPILAIVAFSLLVSAGFYVATAVGVQVEGRHEITVDVPREPIHSPVGQEIYTPSGARLLVTGISRKGSRRQLTATIYGTHRYSVALFPTRLAHTFSMNRPSVEWTVLQASNLPIDGYPRGSKASWHEIH
ncbi:hypothetical protein [Luteolibacter marinus]|uniref:hypothetical protein n=1 Tax=Luteolibacter marinus TaxID=2776705 RepID=UPI001868DD73|nr:hypothetical protein [Luteolibacter marinus]